MQRTPEIEAYWAAFRVAAGLGHDRYVVVEMGDSPELADELVDLMLAGRKRATAALARDLKAKSRCRGRRPRRGGRQHRRAALHLADDRGHASSP